jgi:ribonuclease HI
MITLYTDGSIEGGNPGGWAVGGWVAFDDDGNVLARDTFDLGKGPRRTNNMAEYAAVLGGIKWIADRVDRGTRVCIRSDSQLVVNQLTGKWLCRHSMLQLYKHFIQSEIAGNGLAAEFEWIPRAHNKAADLMSRRLYFKKEAGKDKLARYLQKLDKACDATGDVVRKGRK